MSNLIKTAAASDIAAAFGMLPAPYATTSVEVMTAAQRIRLAGTGLSKADFGKGHPPRGIPPL